MVRKLDNFANFLEKHTPLDVGQVGQIRYEYTNHTRHFHSGEAKRFYAKKLTDLGYDASTDAKYELAVRDIQTRFGLHLDGDIGKNTSYAIEMSELFSIKKGESIKPEIKAVVQIHEATGKRDNSKVEDSFYNKDESTKPKLTGIFQAHKRNNDTGFKITNSYEEIDTRTRGTIDKMVKNFEGFYAKPYRCSAGVCTIGYGTTEYAGKKVTGGHPKISEHRATELMHDVFDRKVSQLEHLSPGIINRINNVSPNALVGYMSCMYNLTDKSAARVTKKIDHALDKGGDENDIASIIEGYTKVHGGGRSKGLVNRRSIEADVIRGHYHAADEKFMEQKGKNLLTDLINLPHVAPDSLKPTLVADQKPRPPVENLPVI